MYTFYSPHFVLSLLATVPAAQAVQEVAPAVLIVFLPHFIHEPISNFLNVPALHSPEMLLRYDVHSSSFTVLHVL